MLYEVITFDAQLTRIENEFAPLLERLDWVSLGGGIHFTGENYPIEELAARLRAFSERFGVQVYLEPGEASITQSTTLEVSVLDLLDNKVKFTGELPKETPLLLQLLFNAFPILLLIAVWVYFMRQMQGGGGGKGPMSFGKFV